MEIVTELALHSKQQDINIKPPPNLAKCVIIVIRKQATPHSFCLITNQFSMGKFTAGGEVKEVCLVVTGVGDPSHVLGSLLVSFLPCLDKKEINKMKNMQEAASTGTLLAGSKLTAPTLPYTMFISNNLSYCHRSFNRVSQSVSPSAHTIGRLP